MSNNYLILIAIFLPFLVFNVVVADDRRPDNDDKSMTNQILKQKDNGSLDKANIEKKVIDISKSVKNAEKKAEDIEKVADAQYNLEGTIFESIIDLEKDKILARISNEREKLEVEKKRMAVEHLRIEQELKKLNGELEKEKLDTLAELEKANEKWKSSIDKDIKDAIAKVKKDVIKDLDRASTSNTKNFNNENSVSKSSNTFVPKTPDSVKAYTIVKISGAGEKLTATVQNIKNKREYLLTKGSDLDGYHVDNISIRDGIVLSLDDKKFLIDFK
ncbi:MAG: hypothetical protein JJV93_02155 [Alphaproteobacteria bacterium]|nr:hypothetical protein [Alphaproteobacteria bacterium]MBL0718042.1 hypothetical protein [Alphaproteobacteria bacterium]